MRTHTDKKRKHTLRAMLMVALVCGPGICGPGSGCQRAALGDYCYRVEIVLDGHDWSYWRFISMAGSRGDLAGWLTINGLDDQCRYRVMRVSEAQEVEEYLCVPHQEDPDDPVEGVGPTTPPWDWGERLFLKWTVRMLPDRGHGCFESPVSYELWNLTDGPLTAFTSPYALGGIIRPDRFIGELSSCDRDPEAPFSLYLVDGGGQLLREHPVGHLEWWRAIVDPVTRDYYLRWGLMFGETAETLGFDPDGQELPLVRGEATGCRFAGALGGVQAFVCPGGSSGYFLVAGRPGGDVTSADLPENGRGALGGEGRIVAVALESGRLSVYRLSEDRLEHLWAREISGEVYDVYVGWGADPLIGVDTVDNEMHIFDLHGRPVLTDTSNARGIVGDVGGYVTLFGDWIRTYRVTRMAGCGLPGGLAGDLN